MSTVNFLSKLLRLPKIGFPAFWPMRCHAENRGACFSKPYTLPLRSFFGFRQYAAFALRQSKRMRWPLLG